MKKQSVSTVLRALNAGGVRYLVAGGLAVNAHGFLRFTADVDLVVELEPENIRKAFAALESVTYRPSVPVTVEAFADTGTRKGWIRDKGMRVLQFYSDKHRETPVDVFVEMPFPFGREYGKALVKDLIGKVEIRFVSLTTLLRMKKSAGRPKDLEDIRELRRQRKNHGKTP